MRSTCALNATASPASAAVQSCCCCRPTTPRTHRRESTWAAQNAAHDHVYGESHTKPSYDPHSSATADPYDAPYDPTGTPMEQHGASSFGYGSEGGHGPSAYEQGPDAYDQYQMPPALPPSLPSAPQLDTSWDSSQQYHGEI